MRNALTSLMVLGTVMFLAAPAVADWDPGDGHKMHFPQLPDPDGWDVNFMDPLVLADDWQCIETAAVEDIHFWFSSREDKEFVIQNVHVSIHSNVDTPRRPGDLLWDRDFPLDSFTIREYGNGDQGWYDPNISETVPSDHDVIWQCNIVNIPDPFIQVENTIYWLELSVSATDPSGDLTVQLGWKTSGGDNWNHSGVFWVEQGSWHDLYRPNPGEPLDLAFVITPEPTTLILLATGTVALLAFAWRKRLAKWTQR